MEQLPDSSEHSALEGEKAPEQELPHENETIPVGVTPVTVTIHATEVPTETGFGEHVSDVDDDALETLRLDTPLLG